MIYNKHQQRVMRQALSFPRARHDVGTRIRLTKRQSKRMSCISSSPVWPYLSILFLLWLQLSLSHFTFQCFHGSIKHLSFVCHVHHCCCCNIVTNITREEAPLGCVLQYPPFNKQCYVIAERQRWTEKQRR